MSKTHVDESQDDIDAALDAFIAHKKITPVTSQPSSGVDLFAGSDVKKKLVKPTFLQRAIKSLYSLFSSKNRVLI